jgi:hypothetical protein
MQDFSEYLFRNNKIIKLVEIEAWEIEVGSKQKQRYIYITFKIVHKILFYSIKKLKQRFFLWLNIYNNTVGWAIYANFAQNIVKINYIIRINIKKEI